MSIHEHSDAIKAYILKQVEAYALENGIDFPKGSLSQNITLSREDLESIVNPPPLKKKPKKVNFNIKPKRKFNIKPKKASDYDLFVSICGKHELEYFEFYDENNWSGPALKVDDSEYDIISQYFNSIEINSISGTGFYIIHPTNKCVNNITYKDEPIESCKLEPNSLIIPTSDDEVPVSVDEPIAEVPISVYDQPTDDEESGEELVLEEWVHEKTNITYLVDKTTNNLYCNTTEEIIGKKVDEFTIELN
jgi:hypothetical protein